jgi:hypothetical protein
MSVNISIFIIISFERCEFKKHHPGSCPFRCGDTVVPDN